jgi:hypothetical protein
VVASKDGKHCDVLAHGDLDGDGKLSTFKLSLTVDSKTKELVIPRTVTEEDPTE